MAPGRVSLTAPGGLHCVGIVCTCLPAMHTHTPRECKAASNSEVTENHSHTDAAGMASAVSHTHTVAYLDAVHGSDGSDGDGGGAPHDLGDMGHVAGRDTAAEADVLGHVPDSDGLSGEDTCAVCHPYVRARSCLCMSLCGCVVACVCVTENERERERERGGVPRAASSCGFVHTFLGVGLTHFACCANHIAVYDDHGPSSSSNPLRHASASVQNSITSAVLDEIDQLERLRGDDTPVHTQPQPLPAATSAAQAGHDFGTGEAVSQGPSGA